MKTTFLTFAGLFLTAGLPLFSADADPKAYVSIAARRLADQPSFRWQTTVELDGLFRGRGPATGQYEKDGYTRVRTPSIDGALEFVVKGGKAAVLIEEDWQTLEQVAAGAAINPALSTLPRCWSEL